MVSSQNPLSTDMSHASGWYAILPQPAPANRLMGHQVADWVVVGAGVTGLAAARRLAELKPQARIILLEEYRIGYGASGRNSGFIIKTPHLLRQLDTTSHQRLSRLLSAGLADLKHLVRTHSIDCEWSQRGHLDAGRSKWVKGLQAKCRALDAIGEKYEWLEGDALADVVGTHYYHAAVLSPDTVLVNPAALCCGLGATLPNNVEIYEESPVRRVKPALPIEIECAEGSIRAGAVLLVNNSFVTQLGFLRQKVFPLVACTSLSRPLTEAESEAMIGASSWGIAGFATVRRTLSNRILVRHGTYGMKDFRLSQDMRRRLQDSHAKGLRKRFPMLDNLDFEHTWSGVFCMTRNWTSFFGRLERGIYAALGYCGVGLARGTISGKLLAEFALGSQSDLISDVQELSGPNKLLPEPLLGFSVHAGLYWSNWRCKDEW